MRLIDADALEYQMLYRENWLKGTGSEAQAIWKEDIDSQHTIDAVPVVRCRECKHYKPSKYNGGTALYCGVIDGFPKEHWFCADGQRREDGDNGKHL